MKYTQMLAEMTLARRWSEWQAAHNWGGSVEQFMAHLRSLVSDPEKIERVTWCAHCSNVFDVDQTHPLEAGPTCPDCWERYYPVCEHCGERARCRTMGSRRVCPACLAQRYFLCRQCNNYYLRRYLDAHRHGHDECCASPALEFTFPHGEGRIAQDERVQVFLVEGLVSNPAYLEVQRLLIREAKNIGDVHDQTSRAYKMYRLGNQLTTYVTRDVKTKEGNFPTRVKRAAYKNYSLKLEPRILTEVGNLVGANSKGATFEVAVTRDVNLPPAEFGNNRSCWWTDYTESRCTLKSNGGLGLRAFDGDAVTGRVWVMGVKQGVDGRMVPTFDTHTGIYLVFNGYGVLAETTGPRVVQHLTGAETYRRVSVGAESDGRFYINNNSGYLVGPRDPIERSTPYGLSWTLATHSHLYERETDAGQLALQSTLQPTRRYTRAVAS